MLIFTDSTTNGYNKKLRNQFFFLTVFILLCDVTIQYKSNLLLYFICCNFLCEGDYCLAGSSIQHVFSSCNQGICKQSLSKGSLWYLMV